MARKKQIATDMPAIDESWRARDDLRTLSSAHEIGQDKKRMKAAQAEAKRQMTALEKVAGKASPRKRKSRREKLENVEL